MYNQYWIDQDIDENFDVNDQPNINDIKSSLEYCFDDKFLPFLKQKLIEEGVI